MKRNKQSIVISLILSLALALPVLPAYGANGGAAAGVTSEMTKAAYWIDNAISDPNAVLLTPSEIDKRNQEIVDTSGVSTYDMAKFGELYGESYNADKKREALSKTEIPTRDLYINGELINNEEYYTKLNNAIAETGFRGTNYPNIYAICTTFANVKHIPTDDVIGYNPTDEDDEIQESALLINEPFVIRQKCEVDGETFYYGYSGNISGWVNAKKLAICNDEAQWRDAWYVKTNARDFLVVTEDKIVLEPSLFTTYSSKVNLTFGTVLKLVPKSKLPEKVGERGTWNNHVVYLPTRTEDGKYKEEMALISEHYDVSIGYVPLTQSNILKLAFKSLGNRYGWGSMLESMDCSAYVRNIYKCCGLYLPRNSGWQRMVADTEIGISGYSDEEKTAVLAGLPAGTPIYFNGHAMVYIGTVDGVNYVISDTGTIADTPDNSKAIKQYSVLINPLTCKRASGVTWLDAMAAAVVWPYMERINKCDISAIKVTGGNQGTIVKVFDGDKVLRENTDYVLVYPADGIVSVVGRGSYVGIQRVNIVNNNNNYVNFSDVFNSDYFFDAVNWAVKENISSGISDLLFEPDADCTRAQMITFLWRYAGKPEPIAKSNPFTDKAAGSYYHKAVTWAYENGIVSGTAAKLLSPEKTITRGEALTMIYRFVKAGEADLITSFTDIELGAYYEKAVSWASKNNIAKGLSENTFGPDVSCSRAQIITFLYRLSQSDAQLEA